MCGMGCGSFLCQGKGTGLCLHRLEGLARELGCTVGAGDLGRPGGQRCAESRLPGGRGCRGCQLLSAPGDAGAQRPRMGPIYSEEPGGCRHGPVMGCRGCRWGVACWHFLISDDFELCTWCSGSRSCSEGREDKTPGCTLSWHCIPRQTHWYPSSHPPAQCPVACAALMTDLGQVRLWAYRVYLGWHRARCDFCLLRLVPYIVPKMRGGSCSPCANTVMPWGPLTFGDGHWPGGLLAPAACCDGLQGTGTSQCLWDTSSCVRGCGSHWSPN